MYELYTCRNDAARACELALSWFPTQPISVGKRSIAASRQRNNTLDVALCDFLSEQRLAVGRMVEQFTYHPLLLDRHLMIDRSPRESVVCKG
jgi:hypothetical protein